MKNTKNKQNRKKTKKIFSGMFLITFGIILFSNIANAIMPESKAITESSDAVQNIADGKQIYDQSCATCHGSNLQGIAEQGPSLSGVGSAAVYFQVSSGRMPATRNEAQIRRKNPVFNQTQIDKLIAYINSSTGGPSVVYTTDKSGNKTLAQEELRGNDKAKGGELFRLNCAQCHNFTGRGGALSSGKFAPNLDFANEQQIYTAMLSGPQNMPKFSDKQLTPSEKKDIIAFIKENSESTSPGGYPIGGFGPVSEGMVMWIFGVTIMVGLAMWIGSRS